MAQPHFLQRYSNERLSIRYLQGPQQDRSSIEHYGNHLQRKSVHRLFLLPHSTPTVLLLIPGVTSPLKYLHPVPYLRLCFRGIQNELRKLTFRMESWNHITPCMTVTKTPPLGDKENDGNPWSAVASRLPELSPAFCRMRYR